MKHRHPASKPNAPNKQAEITIQQEKFFSGPVPAPDLLAKYEEVQPGFADRLIKMAEKEQDKRHEQQGALIQIEKENNLAFNKSVRRGQWLAIVAVFAMIGYCGYLAYLGHADASADAAKYIIVALAAVFITGRFIQKKPDKMDSNSKS